MFCKVDNFFRNTQIDFFPIKIIKIWRVIKKNSPNLKKRNTEPEKFYSNACLVAYLKFTVARRFLERPAKVLLSAIGSFGPLLTHSMFSIGAPCLTI